MNREELLEIAIECASYEYVKQASEYNKIILEALIHLHETGENAAHKVYTGVGRSEVDKGE
jgi:demethoxyubiquinone hydroxylase (CLK1/Coq7/Cat5 family)